VIVGRSNAGYDRTHGGFGYGDRNADGSRILEFANRLNLVICNTLFMKQESQLVTYAAGPVKSTVTYIHVHIYIYNAQHGRACSSNRRRG